MLRSIASILVAVAMLLGTPAEGAEDPMALRPGDRVLGDQDAKLTIVEYASLTCPHCAAFAETTLPRLRAGWIDTGKAKLVFRHHPLDRAALDAAILSECMPEDRFFEFIAMLFEQQGEWATASDPTSRLVELGVDAGLSPDESRACILKTETADRIVALEFKDEKELGINATPTFFVGGKKINGDPGYDGFAALLRQAESR